MYYLNPVIKEKVEMLLNYSTFLQYLSKREKTANYKKINLIKTMRL